MKRLPFILVSAILVAVPMNRAFALAPEKVEPPKQVIQVEKKAETKKTQPPKIEPKVVVPVPEPTPVVAPEPERVQLPPAIPISSVEQIVRDAAIKYGIDPDYLVRIAKCESGLNPNSVNYNYYENGNPSGVFQHISGYFPSRAIKYGYSTNVFDAYANANVTAAMFKDGLQSLWECK